MKSCMMLREPYLPLADVYIYREREKERGGGEGCWFILIFYVDFRFISVLFSILVTAFTLFLELGLYTH